MTDLDLLVDAHCHIEPGSTSVEELLSAMDNLGIRKAVICPADRYIAVLNREGNEYILKAVHEHPNRFIGFATVNPWFGRQAVKELKRFHDMGLRGLKINSFLQGFLLNDELVHPLVETCEKLRMPIYFHTGTPISAMPFQLADLARKFPNVSFIMGHMGYSDFWYDAVPAAKRSENIYLETSHMWVDLIRESVKKVGADRVLFGSDFPKSELSLELEKVKRYLDVSDEERGMILGRNLLKLIDEY